jgi:hypothetical protein
MSRRSIRARTMIVALAVAGACASEATSPSRDDLNGSWSTGHTIEGRARHAPLA